MELEPDVLDTVSAPVARDVAALFAEFHDPRSTLSAPEGTEALSTIRAQLADLQASVADALLAQAGIAPARVLAIGVHDPGLWSSKTSQGVYLGLCDPARLAELSGMSVIDAFPARDVACGGQGGPLAPLAEWVLLHHPTFNRLLIDLGRTTRISYLPRDPGGSSGAPILAFEVGPGMGLVDLLAQRFSGGEQEFDPGGRFAAQGRRIEELIEHWLADPYFRRPLPRWHPRGVRPERYLFDALQMAVERGWSVRDLLCTATHFVAETIAEAVPRRLPDDVRIDEILLTGGGQQNGMLLREIARRFPRVPVTRIDELGLEGESLGPACVAILTLFHLDQVPANRPELTGAEVARVLGRLTPGSPQNWQRLLAEMGASRPAVRPLRSAL
jgi:anhydro-N-acetylmuramic acid kinase